MSQQYTLKNIIADKIIFQGNIPIICNYFNKLGDTYVHIK
jgi:hypothetical protein